MTTQKCPFCETRRILKDALEVIYSAPEINSDFYDDALADVVNAIDNALSTFQCYCDDPAYNSVTKVDL